MQWNSKSADGFKVTTEENNHSYTNRRNQWHTTALCFNIVSPNLTKHCKDPPVRKNMTWRSWDALYPHLIYTTHTGSCTHASQWTRAQNYCVAFFKATGERFLQLILSCSRHTPPHILLFTPLFYSHTGWTRGVNTANTTRSNFDLNQQVIICWRCAWFLLFN